MFEREFSDLKLEREECEHCGAVWINGQHRWSTGCSSHSSELDLAGLERGWRYLGEQVLLPGKMDGRTERSTGVDKCLELCYNEFVPQETTMTKQEELALIAKAQGGSRKAQTEILLKYEKLCHKLARKFAFTAPNHDHDDLFQEAQIGLLSAINSFSVDGGASFMTWAFYKVRGAVAGAGKVDRRQPRYPISVETSRRAYNVEYENEPELKEDLPTGLALQLIEECAGGIGSKRARIVIDRYGLFGYPQLRNCEVCKKYGTNKNAVVSHTYNFKKKVKERFPHLADLV
jgi:RNA polymerase sigma factor (sigma-70 family)